MGFFAFALLGAFAFGREAALRAGRAALPARADDLRDEAMKNSFL
jgi:hypothetical protein